MTPPRSPRPSGHATDALARIAPLVTRWIERLLATHEPPLTVAQYLALHQIAQGGVAAAELARAASVSPAAVSQLLNALEEAGLVERARTPEDRRRQPLALTRQGKRALDSAAAVLRKRLGPLFAELPRPEIEALTRALLQIESLLEGRAPPPRPPRPPRPPAHHPPRRGRSR